MGYLTLIDFKIAEFGYWLEKIAPEFFASFPFLKRTREAFNNLPEIKKYYGNYNTLGKMLTINEMWYYDLWVKEIERVRDQKVHL